VTARVWTVEELDRVHPLPEGWRWLTDDDGETWMAIADNEMQEPACFVWDDGSLGCDEGVPLPVALAVILASQGRDSFKAMAAALDVEAENHLAWAGRVTPTGALNTADQMRESAAVCDAYAHAAEMLRRGRVQP
jgi:hypothetical protein